jgi:uncharacterized membrane protein
MEEKAQGSQKNTGMAVLAYIIFFIPLLTDAKNDPFVKYHVKQGLVLFIGWIVEMFVGVIPFAGWIIAPLLGVFLLVLFIIGIVNAVNCKEKPLPVVGSFAENFKF